jgi:tetratricopeptide (TPR) repeat protein
MRMADDAADRSAGRVARAKSFLDSGQFKDALDVVAGSLERDDASVEERLLHARLLKRLDRGGDALALYRAVAARNPGDARAHMQLCTALLDLGRAAEAEQHLAIVLAKFPKHASLRALHAQAALMTGDVSGALHAIDDALTRDTGNENFKLRRAVILAASGRISDADDVRHGIEDGTTAILAVYREWIFALLRSGQRPLAMTLAENVCVIAPAQAEPWLWKAELLLGEGRDGEALVALKNCTRANEPMRGDVAFRYARARGRALRLAMDKDAAIKAFEEGLAERGEDTTTLRDLYVLNLQTGRGEEMRDYGRKLSAAVAKKLPPNLATELAALRGREPPPSIWDARAQWAWELADKSVWTQEAWLESLYWGQNADNLLRDWWLGAFERVSEIKALIDWPARAPFDTLPPGTPCLCVTTHMGPLACSIVYLQHCGRPYRGFGHAGPDPVVEGQPPMRIASQNSAALREMMAELRKGTLIGFAAESPETHQPMKFDFLGRSITISTLVPRLLWKLKARSVWWHALWREGRAAMELEFLPDPEENEPLDAWCRRWALAYLDRVGRVMRGNPENLNLGHGIWRNVDA